jgi:ABC-type transport system involved in cytochrome bd biosynthesis fused ATPase/permease subunit
MLGERGTNLSGGQRQRLAIARAIVTNPRILILDDATASVDPETEDLIRRGMRFVMLGRTTFVIAHRISTVQRADMVIVIEQGRITQRGTHKQLMSVPGYYRDVAITQLDPDEPHSTEDSQTNPRVPADESPSHIKRLRDEQAVTAAQNQARRASRSADDV